MLGYLEFLNNLILLGQKDITWPTKNNSAKLEKLLNVPEHTKVSRYWRGALDMIQFGDNKPFSIQEITLNAKISRLARGYELGNIVSKCYSVDELENLTNEDLLSDLEQFKIVYHELVALVENNFEFQIEQIFYSESEDGIVCKLDNKTKSSMKVGELTDVPKGLEFKKIWKKELELREIIFLNKNLKLLMVTMLKK